MFSSLQNQWMVFVRMLSSHISLLWPTEPQQHPLAARAQNRKLTVRTHRLQLVPSSSRPPPRALLVETPGPVLPLLPAPGASSSSSVVQAAEVPHQQGLEQQGRHGAEQQGAAAGQPARARVPGHVPGSSGARCAAQTAGRESPPPRPQGSSGRGRRELGTGSG